ncbi:MAG TPA: hypothetical protein PKV73_18105 [Agriterribacter sp.]|nr:hypothetical protein [Agriterribacter sp.]
MNLHLYQILITSIILFFPFFMTPQNGNVYSRQIDQKWFPSNSLPDTTLHEIIRHYEIKLKYIQQKQLEKRSLRSYVDKDSLYYFDSSYENLIEKRSFALAQKIETSMKGKEELKALRYVVLCQ